MARMCNLGGLFYAPGRLVKEGDPSLCLRRLYDLVLEAQGPDGEPATMHMEKKAPRLGERWPGWFRQ